MSTGRFETRTNISTGWRSSGSFLSQFDVQIVQETLHSIGRQHRFRRSRCDFKTGRRDRFSVILCNIHDDKPDGVVQLIQRMCYASQTHTTLRRILDQLIGWGVPYMAYDTASVNLHNVLEQRSEKVHKPRSTVLFRRGEKASGMFVVLSGKVILDLGVDSALARTCGRGALVGLPSTLTRHDYSMTATVTEDAELGFWSPDALDSLLRNRPDLCQPLLTILGEKIAENHERERALITREKQPAI